MNARTIPAHRPRSRPRRGRRLLPRTASAVAATVAVVLTTLPGSPAVAAPQADDFEDRQALFDYPTAVSAVYGLQTEVVTGLDGATVAAFLSGNAGYVTSRPAGGTAWSTPQKVTQSTAWDPELAVGEDGTVAAAFDSVTGIQLVVRPKGRGAWTEPETVSGEHHRVAVGPDGAVTLAVSRYEFSAGGYQLLTHRRGPARRAGLSAGRPVWPAEGSAGLTSLATTPDGRAVLAWLHNGPGAADEVRMAMGTVGRHRWRARQVLATRTADDQEFGSVTAALSASGDASVLWSRWQLQTLDGRVETRTRRADGTTTAPVVLRDLGTGRSRNLQVAATGDGTTIAVWEENDQQLRAATRAPGSASWSSPASLGTAWQRSGFTDNVRLVPGPGATALLTWGHVVRTGGNSEVLVRQHGSGGWEPAYRLAEPGTDLAWENLEPVAAIGAGGRQTLAWYRGQGIGGTSGVRQIVTRSTAVPPVSLRGPVRITGRAKVGARMTCSAPFTDAARTTHTWRQGRKVVGRKAVLRPDTSLRGKRVTCTASGRNIHGPLTETSRKSARIRR